MTKPLISTQSMEQEKEMVNEHKKSTPTERKKIKPKDTECKSGRVSKDKESLTKIAEK
jgi:hypothetical protein